MARVKPVWSTVDPVGRMVAELLEREYGVDVCVNADCEFPGFEVDTPYLDDLHERLPGYDAYVVVSRHESASGRPTLSLHHTGNPTGAALGGDPRSLEWAWPRLLYHLFHEYLSVARSRGLLERYEFTLEATHHGPTRVPRPVVFIEIGSGERQWGDREALDALAYVVWGLVQGSFDPGRVECTPVSGFGDTHYPRVHTRLEAEEGYCYAHILSKHVIREVDEAVVRQALVKSVDRVERAVVTKIPGAARRLVERVAGELGVVVERRG